MRLYFYCDNCGSTVVLQDRVWLGDCKTNCPICGTDSGEFVELVPKMLKEDMKEEKHYE